MAPAGAVAGAVGAAGTGATVGGVLGGNVLREFAVRFAHRRDDAETARVRKQVRHGGALRELADAAPVLPLIEEDARGEAVAQAHRDLHALLAHDAAQQQLALTRELDARNLPVGGSYVVGASSASDAACTSRSPRRPR